MTLLYLWRRELENNMKGLLIKDLKIVASQKKFFFIAILFSVIFAWTGEDVTFASTYLVLIISMLTLTTISHDDFNGGMLFILTLPTTRKIYTKEKYIFAFLNLILGALCSILVCVIIGTIKGSSIPWEAIISSTAGITLAMGFMLAVTIPLEFKFGVEKGRIAMITAVAIIFLVGAGGYKLLTDVFHVDLKSTVAELISKLPSNGQLVGIIIGSFMFVLLLDMLFVSYLISNKIMKKKEF